MRINLFVASATGLSRRAADKYILKGKISINNRLATPGDQVSDSDIVKLNSQLLTLPTSTQTIILNKPVGYVCSRDGQGSKTIYDLLPSELHKLKLVGRLDKDSSGLLVLTNDGKLAHELTHPSFNKEKVYEINLDKNLSESDRQQIEEGVRLDDGLSRLKLNGQDSDWTITMSEGRNRQIRRTFSALGYKVLKLHRTQFGNYRLNSLNQGGFLAIK